MTFSHELGHLVGGWCCGGTLVDVELLPWRLPYSFFDPDPHPLVTLWSGPLLGVIGPVLMAATIRRNWGWVIANFCVLANGIYIATAWLAGDDQLDTPKLLQHGAPPITIVFYCVITIGVGYAGFRHSCIRFFSRATPEDSATDHQAEF